ncbi:hypothetical protein DRQ53_07820 [bacterium]|nr:MAG: hypothetical protein DRQ53_07820 [bacterium]
MPGCHAAAEIDGRVVANDLMTVDAYIPGASFWSFPAVGGQQGLSFPQTPSAFPIIQFDRNYHGILRATSLGQRRIGRYRQP